MKFFLEIKFYFFPTFRKIKVGGFVNQLIKKLGLNHCFVCMFLCLSMFHCLFLLSWDGMGYATNKNPS